jgi:hypothetical protein
MVGMNIQMLDRGKPLVIGVVSLFENDRSCHQLFLKAACFELRL